MDSLRGMGRFSFSAILGAECDNSFQHGLLGPFHTQIARVDAFLRLFIPSTPFQGIWVAAKSGGDCP
jgi:hypothetical protein